MLTSNRTGLDTAAPPDTHRDGDLAGTLTVWMPVPAPTPPPQTGITGMETLLQHLLPGTSVPASRSSPSPPHRDWTTIVCFSCGKFKLVHGVAGARNWMKHARTCYQDGRRRRWAPIT